MGTLEMPLINCAVNLILTWYGKCVISSATGKTKFAIRDTKVCVSVVTLWTPGNVKLLKQLESGFRRTINWMKYQSKLTEQMQNSYLDYLIDASFQWVNRLFVLSFGNRTDRIVHTGCCISKVEIKDYSVIIDGRIFFNQPIKNDLKKYDNIRKIATGQGGDYTWLFPRLSTFQGTLQANCNRFK